MITNLAFIDLSNSSASTSTRLTGYGPGTAKTRSHNQCSVNLYIRFLQKSSEIGEPMENIFICNAEKCATW